MTGPACSSPEYRAPGSRLPLCRTNCTGPWKTATVTTDPSAVCTRETVTPGATAAGSGRADELPPEADGVPAMAAGGTEDELHAAVIHTPATAVAIAHTTCLYLGTCPRMRGDSEGTVKSRRCTRS